MEGGQDCFRRAWARKVYLSCTLMMASLARPVTNRRVCVPFKEDITSTTLQCTQFDKYFGCRSRSRRRPAPVGIRRIGQKKGREERKMKKNLRTEIQLFLLMNESLPRTFFCDSCHQLRRHKTSGLELIYENALCSFQSH